MLKNPITLEIWSDVVCPWCCIGRRNLEIALKSYGHDNPVRVVHRSFLLDPDAPMDTGERALDMLQQKFGMDAADMAHMADRVTQAAALVGLDFHMENLPVTNTREAHALVHLAQENGRGEVLLDRLFRAYFTENLDIGQSRILVPLAAEVGLHPAEVLEALDQGAYEDQLAQDMARARALGIQGVPFFLFNEEFALAGAQAPSYLLQALYRAEGPSLKPQRP